MEALFTRDETGRTVLVATARNRIKSAAKELRHLFGMTLEDMAARAGVSKSQWHNYESVTAPDLIPIHVFLPLELELGHAPVTRAMATMNGLSVSSGASVELRAKAAVLMGRVARESGEAIATLAEVVADGHVTVNEAKQLETEFADMERAAGDVRVFAASIIAGQDE